MLALTFNAVERVLDGDRELKPVVQCIGKHAAIASWTAGIKAHFLSVISQTSRMWQTTQILLDATA